MPRRSSMPEQTWKSSIALGLAISLALNGCATLPPPSREEIQEQALPNAELPPGWKAGAQAGAVGDGWLATFGDPQLEALVAEALANNPDLQIAAARIEQADAQVDIAEAQLRPAVGILARAGSKPVSDLIAMFTGAFLRLAWEIDLWGRLRYARNAELAERDAASADYRFAQQSLAAAVARAWFLVVQTGRQKRIADAMAESAQRLVGLANERLDVGAGSEQDVLIARTNRATYQDAARQVELAHRQALRALELLLGRYPGATLAAATQLPGFPGPVPAGIPSEVLSRRPDMLAAEQRVAAAFNRVGEAKAAFLPSLSLSLGVGRISSEAAELQEDLERTTTSASATLVAPIYTGGALTGEVRLRTAEQQQAVAEYARTALQALNEVEDALNAEQVLTERESILRAAVEDSRRVTTLELDSYRVGRSDLRDVTQSVLAANAAEVTWLQVQRERLNRRVDLHLALGGGFALSAAPAEREETGSLAPAGGNESTQ